MKRKYKFINNSYDSLSGNCSAIRYSNLCKDMHVLVELASTTMEHYMKMKNHIHMLTKQFSGSSCKHNPPSQALQGRSTTCNLFVDGMTVESNKVHSPLVKITRGKPPSRRLVSAVKKVVVKKSQGIKNQPSDTNPKEKRQKKRLLL